MSTTLALLIGAVAASTACMSVSRSGSGQMSSDRMSSAQMDGMMSGWSKASRDAVAFMKGKYGAPAAMTADMAVWGRTGPWKRTIVFAREYAHEFPMHHTDVMQQWIDYKAPVGMFDELAMYDGSVVLERTTGEASARCDKEGANFLALNLAHEVAIGQRSVDDARRMYGEQAMAMMAGRPAPYTERLMFNPMMNTNDPDRPLSAMARP